ncbi:hypothetical protein M1D97_05035 [Kushneria sp. AK178]
MATLLVDWLQSVGLILIVIGVGMVVMGLYTRTFRAALVGVGLLLAAAIVLLIAP